MSNTIHTAAAALARLVLAGVMSAAVLGGAAYPAAAADVDSDTVSEVVTTAGLDLTQPASARLLRQRLQAAARRVCRDKDVHALDPNSSFVGCYQEAMKGAWAQATTMIARAQTGTEVASASH